MLPTSADGKLFPAKAYSQIKEFKVGADVNIEVVSSRIMLLL